MRYQARPWQQLVGQFRDKLDSALDLAAEHVKDAMLDWSADEQNDGEAFREDLPALSRDEARTLLRSRMDNALERILDLLSAGSTALTQERLDEIVSELTAHMVETGQRLQEQVAEAEMFPFGPPQGEWARRYRRILVEDALTE